MATLIHVNREQHILSVLEKLYEARLDESRCNIKLTVDGETFFAQRNVLIAASDFFKKMLCDEKKENGATEVDLQDIDANCMKSCIDFIYGQKVFVSPDSLEELMFAARKMELQGLCEGIEDVMMDGVNPDTYIDFINMAEVFGCTRLRQTCENYAVQNFQIVKMDASFNEIEKDFLRSLLKSSKTKMSEREKLGIVLTWVKHDPENRKDDLKNIIKDIDLEKISIGYRRHIIENEKLIQEDCECLLQVSLSVMNSGKVPSSNLSQKRILIFDRNSAFIKLYDPFKNKVTLTKLLRCDVTWNYSVAIANEYMYVLCENKTVYRLKYADTTKKWQYVSSTICEHGLGPPTAVLEGELYVIGGWGGGLSSKAVERYNEVTNEWRRLPDKQHCTYGATVLEYDRYIYSFGGRVNGEFTNQVEKYDSANSKWVSSLPMLAKRGFVAATEWHENIFVTGGYNAAGSMRSIEMFNVTLNEWTVIPTFNLPRWAHKVHAIGEHLYAVGGYNLPEARESVEKYDEEKREWEYLKLSKDEDLCIIASLLVEIGHR